MSNNNYIQVKLIKYGGNLYLLLHTSSITIHIWWIASVIASAVPLILTVLSVELGNKSEATFTIAPLASRISLIFTPPFPINDPHCDAGTISFIDVEFKFDDFRTFWGCEDEFYKHYLLILFNIKKILLLLTF